MATRMLQRRGTAAEWAAQNPTLVDGEIGFETDTKVIKIGDGVTAWNDLSLSPITAAGTVMTGPLVLIAPTEPNHAARVADLSGYLLKSGGTMTGALTIVAPSLADHAARLADIPTNFVPDTRLVSTGGGLQGGGSLAADRTLSVNADVVQRYDTGSPNKIRKLTQATYDGIATPDASTLYVIVG